MGVSMYLVFNKKLSLPTRKFSRLLLLMISFLCYLMMGSYVNQIINYDLDVDQQTSFIDYLNQFVDNHSSCFNHSDYKELYQLIDSAIDSGIKFGNNRLDNETFTPNWVFGGETLFFTFTLLTTIGYGHIAPLTKAGKLFCIAYITLGVPLTLLLLKSIVARMEHAILHEECCSCSSDPDDGEKKRLVDTDQQPRLNYSTMSESNQEAPVLVDVSRNDHSSGQAPTDRTKAPNAAIRHYTSFFVVGLFLVIFIYIIPSTVLTKYTESQWSFLDAIYYCYISIATIGFGDLVPGYEQSGAERNYYRFLMTIFLFVGILTNMLFLNLFIRLPVLKHLTCDNPGHVDESKPNTAASTSSSTESDDEQAGLLTRSSDKAS